MSLEALRAEIATLQDAWRALRVFLVTAPWSVLSRSANDALQLWAVVTFVALASETNLALAAFAELANSRGTA